MLDVYFMDKQQGSFRTRAALPEVLVSFYQFYITEVVDCFLFLPFYCQI